MATSELGKIKNHNGSVAEDDASSNGDAVNVGNTTTKAITTSMDLDEETWSSHGYKYINPFVQRLQIDNRIDLAKIYVFTVLLLPIRVVGCMISILSAWMFACIGIYGMSLDDLKEKPFTGWRKHMRSVVAGCMRMVFTFGSFHFVTFKGKRAPAKVAPILVVAPHSSYVDAIIVVADTPPSFVAKQETSQIPILGKIINYAQPIYVQREDPNSRQNTIRQIVNRARSSDDWPQVVIFAEGTCTNRTALIKFKPGAFYPGVPVQPVIIRYPNKYDTFTWTWDGPGVLRLLWLTMSQFNSRCEIEFLPVYNPSEEEKKDANLYAKNVREVMAKALNVPTSEYSFEDVIMMSRAKDMKIPFPGDIVEIERTLNDLNLLESDKVLELAKRYSEEPKLEQVNFITFAELLNIDMQNSHLQQLYGIFDHKRDLMNLKSFLLCSIFCTLKNESVIKFLHAITPIYSTSSQRITRPEFNKLMRHAIKITPEKSDALFIAIDELNKGVISFDDLKSYTESRPNYAFLYKKQEHLRNTYKKKTEKSPE